VLLVGTIRREAADDGRRYDALRMTHSPGFADLAIAATARRHDLTILSRNQRHFAPMDAAVVDPFQKLPMDE
jgi:predicted nucleic acid-binding protein